MRTTRVLLAALAFVLVSACSADPAGTLSPTHPSRDGVGVSGSGNSVGADSTFVAESDRGTGWTGSGN
jgi:hypothetical protein